MTTVVVGPRTRLGAEVIRLALAEGEEVVAVARHERDEQALADSPATVVRLYRLDALPRGPVRLHLCALGPVQSGDRVETADVERDLAAVETVLDRATQTHVTLVSSVLALAPKADRRHYAGWKCLVEDRVREAAVRRGASLAVFYPGRLVSGQERVPKNLVNTRYPRLGSLVVHSSQLESQSRVVGLDARLWLLARGARLAVGAFSVSGGGAARKD